MTRKLLGFLSLRSTALLVSATAITGAALLQCVGDDPTTTSSTADAGSDAAVGTDATSTSDAGTDASTCAWDGMFGTPIELAFPDLSIDGGAIEGHPSLSPDELTIYFHGQNGELSDGGTDNDIYVATRKLMTDPFGVPSKLAISTNFTDSSPSISHDGTTLYYDSTTVDGGFTQMWVAQRSSAIGPFGGPHPLGSPPASPLAGISLSDGQPFITADDVELWFTSRRDGGTGGVDVYSSLLSGGLFAAPIEESLLNSSVPDYAPSLSADRLTVYFSSSRLGGGGGADDIWRSHRSTIGDVFGNPQAVVELNSPNDEFGGWLSPDNCRYYFESQRDGIHYPHIYVAERAP